MKRRFPYLRRWKTWTGRAGFTVTVVNWHPKLENLHFYGCRISSYTGVTKTDRVVVQLLSAQRPGWTRDDIWHQSFLRIYPWVWTWKWRNRIQFVRTGTLSVNGIWFLGKGTLSMIPSQATSKMIIVKLPFSMERRLGCRSLWRTRRSFKFYFFNVTSTQIY